MQDTKSPTPRPSHDKEAICESIFKEWNVTTGFVADRTSYYYEMISLIEDGYDKGSQEARELLEEAREYVNGIATSMQYTNELRPAKCLKRIDEYLARTKG